MEYLDLYILTLKNIYFHAKIYITRILYWKINSKMIMWNWNCFCFNDLAEDFSKIKQYTNLNQFLSIALWWCKAQLFHSYSSGPKITSGQFLDLSVGGHTVLMLLDKHEPEWRQWEGPSHSFPNIYIYRIIIL